MATLDFDNLNFEKKSYSWSTSYNNSKLYNILFSIELSKRVKDDGIIVHAVQPGFVATALGKEYGTMTRVFVRIAQSLFGRDAVEGAQTTIYTAVSKEAGESTGQYWASLKVQAPSKIALVPENQEKFWKVSAEAGQYNPKLSKHFYSQAHVSLVTLPGSSSSTRILILPLPSRHAAPHPQPKKHQPYRRHVQIRKQRPVAGSMD
ncbi:hypothetical protein BC937DRAFT_93061 [Endogone sp. FLAS-F59071]|nr:hypothetical protein BC937DRAFT_93061 [Endogone sp. FLAS-F59071]|eukprot:RUS14983.1 hypothetical protein BC937DRAFT_93061 [Endogone sp. FLAS-F59071]